jgi:hypothetical protein
MIKGGRGTFLPVAIFGLVLVTYLILAPYGIDPMHDGIMLGAARLVSEGGAVHRDAFAMYGPLTTWIQVLEYRVGGETLLGLRVGSSIALSLSTLLTFVAFRRLFGDAVAGVSTIFWALSAPFVLGVFDQIPWNSDYVLLFQSASMVLLTRRRQFKVGKWTIEPEWLVGVLMASIFLSRISVGALTMVLVAIDFVIRRRWNSLLKITAGYALCLSLVLFVVMLQGGLSAWWFQFVQFPRLRFLVKAGEGGIENIKMALLTLGIPTSGLLLIARLGIQQSTDRTSKLESKVGAYIFMGAFGCLLIFQNVLNDLWTSERVFWGLLVVSPLLILSGSIPSFSSNSGPIGPPGVFAIAVGSLAQLFPQTDYRHLWWSILPIFGFLVNSLLPRQKSAIGVFLAVSVVVVPVSVDAVTGLRARLSHQYETVENVSILEGMRVRSEFKAAFADQFELINQFQETYGPKTVLNICVDGLFATLGEEMQYPDPNFIVWEDLNVAKLEPARVAYVTENEPIIWYCPGAISSPNVTNRPGVSDVLPDDYRVLSRSVCLNGVGGFDDWPLMSYIAVPKRWTSAELESKLDDQSRCLESDG